MDFLIEKTGETFACELDYICWNLLQLFKSTEWQWHTFDVTVLSVNEYTPFEKKQKKLCLQF